MVGIPTLLTRHIFFPGPVYIAAVAHQGNYEGVRHLNDIKIQAILSDPEQDYPFHWYSKCLLYLLLVRNLW